jgi:septal ring factor EnvC (AmiA/AmiB activator)
MKTKSTEQLMREIRSLKRKLLESQTETERLNLVIRGLDAAVAAAHEEISACEDRIQELEK